jgi:hypothetical protein
MQAPGFSSGVVDDGRMLLNGWPGETPDLLNVLNK